MVKILKREKTPQRDLRHKGDNTTHWNHCPTLKSQRITPGTNSMPNLLKFYNLNGIKGKIEV